MLQVTRKHHAFLHQCHCHASNDVSLHPGNSTHYVAMQMLLYSDVPHAKLRDNIWNHVFIISSSRLINKRMILHKSECRSIFHLYITAYLSRIHDSAVSHLHIIQLWNFQLTFLLKEVRLFFESHICQCFC